MKIITEYKTLLEGVPEAKAVVSKVPLSFWGGVDVATGKILDIHSDIKGEIVKDKILCIPCDRGSCSGSGVLIEMVKQRTAPAAILCIEAEPVLALGPLIGEKMYGHGMALRQISEGDYNGLKTGDTISFEKDSIVVK
jgi:predicted aconitase with swiveling domain